MLGKLIMEVSVPFRSTFKSNPASYTPLFSSPTNTICVGNIFSDINCFKLILQHPRPPVFSRRAGKYILYGRNSSDSAHSHLQNLSVVLRTFYNMWGYAKHLIHIMFMNSGNFCLVKYTLCKFNSCQFSI